MGISFFAIFILIAITAILSVCWRITRASQLLRDWAARNQLEILQSEYCHFFKGPYFWSSGKGQAVFKVTVLDSAGKDRHGYVRVGGFFLGMWSDHVDSELDN